MSPPSSLQPSTTTKKKKQKSGSGPATTPNVDLKSVIHENSLLFDSLVELIPARFYLPSDDDKPWFQGLSKAKKASAKKETKENIKKARRARLDPEKSSTSTLDLLKQNLEKEKNVDKASSDNDDVEVEINPYVGGSEDEGRSVTYEELRQRLRRKIEAMSSVRNSSNPEKHDKEKDRLEHLERKRKRKRLAGSGDVRKPKEDKSAANIEKETTEAAKELTFGLVKLGDDNEQPGKKKRRVSKEKELERAKKLEEAKKDPEKGEVIAKKHSWKAATSRAAGVKIHDNPKLLDKSLKKEKKKHDKNAEKWKDRIETQKKLTSEKQQKRASNIKERKDQKKERKISKREKKLMRPGFEGRKDQPLNGPKP